MRIMVEAIGSMACNAGIKNIKQAGFFAIGTDASAECFTQVLCDEFYQVPLASDPNSVSFLKKLVVDKKIDLVIPTLDEGMIPWAKAVDELEKEKVFVAISPLETIEICEDKWRTYCFFKENGIQTPLTSLKQEYSLVKPINGRGGTGVLIEPGEIDMTGMISQELLQGKEYTIDVLCDKNGCPIYIVPRERLGIKEGKSTGGLVVKNPEIEDGVRKICAALKFRGPINIQCFLCNDNTIKFTEINPRMGGGTALGMAATENWIPLMVDTFVHKKKIYPKADIQYGLKMGRYYNEIFYK